MNPTIQPFMPYFAVFIGIVTVILTIGTIKASNAFTASPVPSRIALSCAAISFALVLLCAAIHATWQPLFFSAMTAINIGLMIIAFNRLPSKEVLDRLKSRIEHEKINSEAFALPNDFNLQTEPDQGGRLLKSTTRIVKKRNGPGVPA